MEIVFRGLCGFAQRTAGAINHVEVSILDGGHHPHKGMLIANAEEVDAIRTTWSADRIFATPSGDVVLIWDIAGLEVEADAGGSSTFWNNADVLDLSMHPSTVAKGPARGIFTVRGGTFTAARSKYAVQPILYQYKTTTVTQIFADQIRWDTAPAASVSITAKLKGSIVFKVMKSPVVSVCNEAAHPGNGLSHFDCYYDLFDLAAGDVKATVAIPAPVHGQPGPYVTLGYNCIDPTRVP